MKYLSKQPFSVGGASRAFDKGWDLVFGKPIWTGIPKSAQGNEKRRVALPEHIAQRCDEQRVDQIVGSANTEIGDYSNVEKRKGFGTE